MGKKRNVKKLKLNIGDRFYRDTLLGKEYGTIKDKSKRVGYKGEIEPIYIVEFDRDIGLSEISINAELNGNIHKTYITKEQAKKLETW